MVPIMDLNWWEQLEQLDQTAGATAALNFLTGIAVQQPDNFDLQFELAQRYRKAGAHSFAVGALLPVSRHAEHHLKFRACLELGDCFEKLGDREGAALAFEQAHILDPGSHWPVIGLARSTAHPERISEVFQLLRPDAKAEAARYLAGLRAQQAYLSARADAGWRVQPPVAIPAFGDAVMLMIVKDEEDIIGQNLRHHYALGFRRFCIIDNASTDQTPNIIAKFRHDFAEARVAVINDFITGYYQSSKVIAAARFAEIYMALDSTPPSWYFCIDADEFITLTGHDTAHRAAVFSQALSDPDKNLCIMHWIHCSSTPMYKSLPLDADPFQYFNKLTSELEPAVPKIAYRPGHGLEPMEGYHFVPHYDHDLSRIIHAADLGIYLMHFSLRTVDHVRRKVINGGRAYEAAKNMDIHGGHWRHRYELYKQHGDAIFPQILASHINDIK
jgi:tetratricopeptide (TPR) repeat protein